MVSLFGNWPFDSERWSLALYVYFAIPMAVAISKLASKRALTASVLLCTFAAFQAPILTNGSNIRFDNANYQYSRLHPSTSTLESLRWLDQQISDSDIILLGDHSPQKAYEYYVLSARVTPFTYLGESTFIEVSGSQALSQTISESGGDKFAFLHFHNLRRAAASIEWIEGHCEILNQLSPEDRFEGHRVLRSKVIIFENCTLD